MRTLFRVIAMIAQQRACINRRVTNPSAGMVDQIDTIPELPPEGRHVLLPSLSAVDFSSQDCNARQFAQSSMN